MMNRRARFMLSMVIVASFIGASTGKRKFFDRREAEIQRRLKQINKPAVRSIQSPDGDIIDCVNIMEQPAFDHPLLKNHTIQMEPSSYPKFFNKGKEVSLNTKGGRVSSVRQPWHRVGECPKNTVPIKRTTREDLLRSDALMKAKKRMPIVNSSYPYSTDGHEYAVVMSQNGQFNGIKTTLSIWKPNVQVPEEFSLAQIWITSGNADPVNSLEAGWQVYQSKYGDANPKFFVFFTRNSYQTGCYNTECPGFVQTDSRVTLAGNIEPISTVGGEQHEIDLLLWKDIRNGNWWIRVGDVNVGYWSSLVVPELTERASTVTWGGEIYDIQKDQHTTTQMGSGYFAQEGYGKAAYFKNIQVVDTSNVVQDPQNYYPFETKSSCYNLILFNQDPHGTSFYYGGPGKNPDCP